ncbi:DUF7311 family protein [Natronorubrum sulfidifaciens]|uniref:DUF7311 domain-containing protein n=1 Tax=Natronorubrum sulfidifaciens JCM 14089 TaxID=1230460 RepID=L9WJ65_9EURY|nr:hypothetical protein [Natronorubrum sulfidifaciens]ELY49427.1 hypothetical protein C495_00640 [Natronorubrum sulfidifaciens JCM 14089]
MIRYVLAVVLTIALLAVAMPVLDRGSTMNTERTVDSSIAAIDDATTAVATEEHSPASHPNPQRVVTVTVPARSVTTTAVDHFEIVPHENGSFSHARYVLEDGTTRETIIDERVVWLDPADTEPIEFDGPGEFEVVLTLHSDSNGDPVIVASHP